MNTIDITTALEDGYLVSENPPQAWLDLLTDQRLPGVVIRVHNGAHYVSAAVKNLEPASPSEARRARKQLIRETEKALRSIPDCRFADAQDVRVIGPMTLKQAKAISKTLLHRDEEITREAA